MDRLETQTEQEDRLFKRLAKHGIVVVRTPAGLHWEWELADDLGDVADFVELMEVLVGRLSVLETLMGIEEEE